MCACAHKHTHACAHTPNEKVSFLENYKVSDNIQWNEELMYMNNSVLIAGVGRVLGGNEIRH